MTEAMQVVDEKYEMKEYFIVDVASSASAMREPSESFDNTSSEIYNCRGKGCDGIAEGEHSEHRKRRIIEV